MSTSLLPAQTRSSGETRALGARMATQLRPGTVLALLGDLGAGKTELVRGLVEGLGGPADEVTSPTFTIAQEYRVEGGVLLHVDAYRVEDPAEFVEMGLEDFMEAAFLVAVEWPSRLGPLLPANAVSIRISHQADGSRLITQA